MRTLLPLLALAIAAFAVDAHATPPAKGTIPAPVMPKPKTATVPNYAQVATDLDQADAGLGQVTVTGTGAQQDVATARLNIAKARTLVASLAAAAHVTLPASGGQGATTLAQIQQTLVSAQGLLQSSQTPGASPDLALAIGKVEAAATAVKGAIEAN